MKNFYPRKISMLAVSLMLFICETRINAQVDKHIDPSAKKHKHTLTIGKHASSSFTIDKAKKAFAYGTKILQTCDNKVNDNQDVAVAVTVEAGSTLGSFGAAGDGLDIINTQAELDQVMNNASFYVKVVIDMPGNGTTLCNGTPPILGCGGGSSIVMVEGLSDEEWGEVIIHEFGHNQGLGHRDSPGKPIMHTSTLGNTEVNDTEAAAFHTGGTEDGPNRPVNITFVVDDTGSMGEEIGAVKNGITAALSALSLFVGNSCNYAYRLVSFKDNVSPRNPSTDLNVVKNQVSALFASGGGDCPEGSVEAVEAIQENVKDGGFVFMFTDAAPHAGTNIEGVKNALQARDVKFFTLLSGDCTSSSLRSLSNSNQDEIPFSDNHDNSTVGLSTASAASISSNPTAIEAFSYLSQETGGLFVFIPEVNSSNPTERLRYENIASNIIIGAIAPAIINNEPPKGPRGGTLAITVTGSQTHFNPTTALAFSDPGITVNNIVVVSPTQLQATITIGASVPLTYHDITATTNVGGGVIETTNGGKGLLQVTAAPTTPTILSISPVSGSVGQTLNVKVTGINTHFTNASVLNLGSGITVLNSTALNNVELAAEIQISSAATPGFRNVVVTTGTEVANETVPGPFLVTAGSATCNLLLSTSAANVSCFNGSNGAIDLTVTNGTSPLSYIWSNGSITEDVSGLTAGTYSVEVTDGRGCKNTASVTITQPASAVTCAISVSPNPTVAGQAAFTIFRGYGPQTVTLTGSGAGGTGSLHYSWGSAGAGNAIVVSPTVTTTYTLTVTDGNGCTCKKSVTINVVDVRCGNKNDKVMVCHNGHENCISANAVPAHLNHGDVLGPCLAVTSITSASRSLVINANEPEILPGEFKVSCYPNPFTKSTRIQYSLPYDSRVSIKVYDGVGRIIATLRSGENKAGTYTVDFDASKLGGGNYYYRINAIAKEKEFTHGGSLILTK